MQGQLSNEEFVAKYPHAQKNVMTNVAVTYYGKYTVNYWIQHEDGSWTNYDCKTRY